MFFCAFDYGNVHEQKGIEVDMVYMHNKLKRWIHGAFLILGIALMVAGCSGDAGKDEYEKGHAYEKGLGVKQDDKQAYEWYRKSAKLGYAQGQYALGIMYNRGSGVKPDAKLTVKWYRKAAEQGFAPAQYFLGVMYEYGQGARRDYKQAVGWYRKAAEQGEAGAQNQLGWMYYKGRGVKQDYKQAAVWYRKAAEQGIVGAQNNLGDMYYYGQGVKQDYKQAVLWYRKSAAQGYSKGQSAMARMYNHGEGVPQDIEAAYDLYRIAAAHGDRKAASRLGSFTDMSNAMTDVLRRQLRDAWLAQLDATTDLKPVEDKSRPLFAKGTEIFALGDYESTLELLELSRQDEGEYAGLFLYRAAAHEALGRHDEALSDIRKAISLKPEMPQAGKLMARTLLIKASKDFGELAQWKPKDYKGHVLHALMLMAQDKHEQAVAELKQMTGGPSPQLTGVAASVLAEAWFWSGFDLLSAIADMNVVLAAVPGNALYLNQRAYLHYLRGEYREAIADAGKAIAQKPEDPLGYNFRARAYRAAGKAEAANTDVRQVTELKQGNRSELNLKEFHVSIFPWENRLA